MTIEKVCLSIIIPTYNSSSYISKTFSSIEKAANGYEFEIIVVDDDSDDIEQLLITAEKYTSVRVINKNKKSNAADSRNIGIRNARYRWVFLLDSDDEALTGVIDRRIDIHQKQSCGLVFGNYVTISNESTVISKYEWKNEDIREFLLVNGGDFRTSTISIDKLFFKGTEFDPESFKHQDWIFGIKCFDSNEKMFFDKLPSAIINVDGDSRMSSRVNLAASRYLVNNYIYNQEYKNGFSKKNWKNVIAANDLIAKKYFFSIFKPFSIKERFIFLFYKVVSSKFLMPFSSRLIKSLRKIKWQLVRFRY